ncbi:MAG: DNA replication/repair protein RecF [Ktedonobacteraceae bacterium]|nr:DNA replication/repair protein RecF [Ktedonobacteraceae bacterium]
MYLSHLSLNEFRNYKHLNLSLGPGLFLFYGDNAQGKTNLLEAVSVLATATSFHAASDREVVNWNAPEHVARLEGTVKRREDTVQIEIALFDPLVGAEAATLHRTTPAGFELPANTPRKRMKVNGIPRKTVDLIGQMKVVLFSPTDLHLVDGAPDERRRFLDRALCQVQPRYCQALVKYRKVVTQRAALLKRIRDYQEDPRLQDYLDEQLTMLATLIMYERQRMVSMLNQQANTMQATISGGREHLQIVYRPSFTFDETGNTIEAEQHYRAQLRQMRKREIQQGVCLLGPHRDELEFLVNGVSMLTYGSRGQQRTVALSAKLAELAYMHTCTGDEPVLLLDDVFSELDAQRRTFLQQQVLQHEQVLLTTTDIESFPAEMVKQTHLFHVVAGALIGA